MSHRRSLSDPLHPSEAQLNYAKAIADALHIDCPNPNNGTREEFSAFISEHVHEFNKYKKAESRSKHNSNGDAYYIPKNATVLDALKEVFDFMEMWEQEDGYEFYGDDGCSFIISKELANKNFSDLRKQSKEIAAQHMEELFEADPLFDNICDQFRINESEQLPITDIIGIARDSGIINPF